MCAIDHSHGQGHKYPRLPGEPGPDELRTLAAANPLPGDFRFGVAMAAFQNEGGYNGHTEPKNNFFDWEDTRRVERSGIATNFWADPWSHLDRASAMGCNGYRLSLEWARIYPVNEPAQAPAPSPDDSALDRYAEILAACRERSMEPLVTIHHFTHPRWLGLDAWTRYSTVDNFVDYVETAVSAINERLVKAGGEPLRNYVTINEPNGPGATGYFVGQFPPGRYLDARSALRATDNIVAAHVRAYNKIHDIHESNSWATPSVTTNTFVTWTWGLERVIPDLLLARENGVEPSGLDAYFDESRRRLRELRAQDPNPPEQWRMTVERGIDWVTDHIKARHFPESVKACYEAPRASNLDYIGIDYYDPYISRGIKMPGRQTAAGSRWRPVADFWEQVVNPAGLALICRAATINAEGKSIVIAENGMASHTKGKLSYGRPDGITRDDYIRRHLAQILVARGAGIDLMGYYHWTLVDNYEWGSYEPCFGIHGIDRSGTTPVITDDDAMGCLAANAYREAIEAMRSGDAGEIARVLSQ